MMLSPFQDGAVYHQSKPPARLAAVAVPQQPVHHRAIDGHLNYLDAPAVLLAITALLQPLTLAPALVR
jgi:hypothetical protein